MRQGSAALYLTIAVRLAVERYARRVSRIARNRTACSCAAVRYRTRFRLLFSAGCTRELCLAR